MPRELSENGSSIAPDKTFTKSASSHFTSSFKAAFDRITRRRKHQLEKLQQQKQLQQQQQQQQQLLLQQQQLLLRQQQQSQKQQDILPQPAVEQPAAAAAVKTSLPSFLNLHVAIVNQPSIICASIGFPTQIQQLLLQPPLGLTTADWPYSNLHVLTDNYRNQRLNERWKLATGYAITALLISKVMSLVVGVLMSLFSVDIVAPSTRVQRVLLSPLVTLIVFAILVLTKCANETLFELCESFRRRRRRLTTAEETAKQGATSPEIESSDSSSSSSNDDCHDDG